MNKQALAFLSMFTLILMLSLYYVSLDETPASTPVINQVSDVIALDKKKISDLRNDEILEQKNILSDANSSEGEKSQALSKIDKLNAASDQEKEIVDRISESNIKSNVYIKDSIIHVTIYEQTKSDELATNIMNSFYDLVKENQQIELSFS